MSNSIQSREYSKDGGIEDVLYITDSDGDPNVFNVNRNDSELWLNANHAHSGNLWNPDNLWAFCPPRNCFLSPVIYWQEFFLKVSLFFQSIPQSFFLFLLSFQREQYISYYPKLLFPS